ncbi:DUF924 family protein [Sinorhizobium meliloti]|uniref:DUF924 family protein n=1 Tax=Rhizobium meliloti TaxID=382 RepID=UPI001294E569|nr:DUF924 family protein [Sinorhizobium meliloti]MDW9594900.1 DUF924 family protein [Sinorhizobium meliloti]MDX0189879.1 DUF924 family protein [Sinorhizobium meliloti]MQV11146.1 DUF924 family protein [Sinorhizobium meliloti]MQV61535.1 DUF924 family protein [Sinorhizobium meliloti]
MSDFIGYIEALALRNSQPAEEQSRAPAPADRAFNMRLREALAGSDEAAAIIRFWREAGPTRWFAKEAEFDRAFRERFLTSHKAAARGELLDWTVSPEKTLALILLLDQFPRNAFRGTPRMYETDALALGVARAAINAGYDLKGPADLKLFFYLPFAHSERLADQEQSVELARRLGEPSLSHAKGHRDIIRRFGRFPHRNWILARAMTEDEQRFLDEGGFAG